MPTGVEGYIIDYESDLFPSKLVGKYHVKFLYYDDIEGGVDPAYDDVTVRGRSEEHAFYSNTSAENYSLAIHLPASVDSADDGNAEKIYQDYLFIKSFAYPDYGINNQGPILPPRKAIVVIGNYFKKVGLIKSSSWTFSRVCDPNGYPLFIDMRLTLRVINIRPLSLRDIRSEKTYSE